MPPRRRFTQDAALRLHGVRSGLEEKVAEQLRKGGVDYQYESLVIRFTQPAKPRRYTPDFVLHNGIIIETKGRFVTADRQKHLLVQAQHPDLDIRFLFSNSRTRISKKSETTYAAWCAAKGFLFADRVVPCSWLDEPDNERSLNAIHRLAGLSGAVE